MVIRIIFSEPFFARLQASIEMLEDILGHSMDDCDASMEERAMPRRDPPLSPGLAKHRSV
jgi:hypothetical protein